mgnify:CR=1 FL=1
MIGFAFAGLLLGLILGVYCPFRVPPEYARLLAVAVMAGMDAVLHLKAIMILRYSFPDSLSMVFWLPFCAMQVI